MNNSTEDAFRLWAFSTYYHEHREDLDMTRRFCRAIVESARPVAPGMIAAWKAARKEITAISRAEREGKIDSAESARQVREAIQAHLGVTYRDRAWQQKDNEDDLTNGSRSEFSRV